MQSSPGIDAPHDANLWRHEAFGPVAIVVAAEDSDAALRLANDSLFGLQAALFTRSLRSALRFSEEFEGGSLWVSGLRATPTRR